MAKTKQVHLKSLGNDKSGLFPKLIFDEDGKKIIIKVKEMIAGKWTGKYIEYATPLTDTVVS